MKFHEFVQTHRQIMVDDLIKIIDPIMYRLGYTPDTSSWNLSEFIKVYTKESERLEFSFDVCCEDFIVTYFGNTYDHFSLGLEAPGQEIDDLDKLEEIITTYIQKVTQALRKKQL